jgi:hypothetical protein
MEMVTAPPLFVNYAPIVDQKALLGVTPDETLRGRVPEELLHRWGSPQ